MTVSRDRGKKRAGKNVRPKKISDGEFQQKVSEFCQLARQQNRELIALLQRQQQLLLGMLRTEDIK
jgi:hypothetical protein